MVSQLGSQYLNLHPDSWSRTFLPVSTRRGNTVPCEVTGTDLFLEQLNQPPNWWMDPLLFVLAPLLCFSAAPEQHPLSRHPSDLA